MFWNISGCDTWMCCFLRGCLVDVKCANFCCFYDKFHSGCMFHQMVPKKRQCLSLFWAPLLRTTILKKKYMFIHIRCLKHRENKGPKTQRARRPPCIWISHNNRDIFMNMFRRCAAKRSSYPNLAEQLGTGRRGQRRVESDNPAERSQKASKPSGAHETTTTETNDATSTRAPVKILPSQYTDDDINRTRNGQSVDGKRKSLVRLARTLAEVELRIRALQSPQCLSPFCDAARSNRRGLTSQGGFLCAATEEKNHGRSLCTMHSHRVAQQETSQGRSKPEQCDDPRSSARTR